MHDELSVTGQTRLSQVMCLKMSPQIHVAAPLHRAYYSLQNHFFFL